MKTSFSLLGFLQFTLSKVNKEIRQTRTSRTQALKLCMYVCMSSLLRSLLKEATIFVLYNCFFAIGNITMIQVIGIPMGSDPAPFLAHLCLA